MKKQTKKPHKKKFKILAAGDFHGNSDIAKKLANKAEKEKVDLVVLTGDIIGMVETDNLLKPFKDKQQKVIFVPGNWDTKEAAETLSKLYNVKDIGKHYVKYKDIGIFGIGSEDWQLHLDEEKTFNKLKKDFEQIKNLEKKILVSHLHAADTKSELSGFQGSTALKKAIKEFQPDLFISGHIHEGEGLYEKIGKTKVLNVGKTGKIIEI
tara:strand:+ start:24000 stop:24626 length:627 start_codon:yes stop_codon:yes gene_type:complete